MTDSVPDSCIADIDKLLKQIQAMNLFNDTFISVVFKDEGACLHLVRHLMQNPALRIWPFAAHAISKDCQGWRYKSRRTV